MWIINKIAQAFIESIKPTLEEHIAKEVNKSVTKEIAFMVGGLPYASCLFCGAGITRNSGAYRHKGSFLCIGCLPKYTEAIKTGVPTEHFIDNERVYKLQPKPTRE